MSSATTMDRRTYWCHECDMSISLTPTTLTTTTTTTTTSCPHCTSGFLAELDSPFTFDTQNYNTNNNNNHDTNLIFDSPYFHHVINHLFNNNFDQSSYGHDNNTNTNNDHLTNATTSDQNKLLALSKGDINSIKSVKITTQLLENDPVVICAVCKELFEIDDDVKELPCKHMYHPSCIIPWLSIRNSCPLCRFEMPVQEEEWELKVRRGSRSSVLRGEDFMDDDDEHDGEEELSGFGLRHLARRHRLIFPMRRNDQLQPRQVEEEILFTPSQIGEEEVEVGDSARTGNVDTVSSWPNWPVVDGGEIAMGSANVNDDVDVVMS